MIILDTNVLPRRGSLAGPTIALVRAVAQKTGHEVALPAIVVEESVAEFSRELSALWEKARTVADALAGFFPGYRIDQPDLNERGKQWRTELEQAFTILDPPAGAAEEALRREAHRIAPTRAGGEKGSGARDALIWLTALEAYRREPADGAIYFVTNNSRDFGSDKLQPSLQEEVDWIGSRASFHYLNSMSDLLEQLAVPVRPGPSREELLGSDAVLAAVNAALGSIDIVGSDRWRPEVLVTPLHPSVRPVLSVTLRSAESTTAYQVGDQRFAVVPTVWEGVSTGLRFLGAEIGGSGVSQELKEYHSTRLLLLVELGEDGRVTAADVVSSEPFVYERTEVHTRD